MRNERGAFDLLVLKYQHKVVKLVARLLRDPTEAEDVAQEAFVKAQSELMRAVSKGVVHKNTGSRKVSRLAAQLKKLSAA